MSSARGATDKGIEPDAFVTEYLNRKGPKIAELHDAFAMESDFNESKSKYELKGKDQEFMEALEQYGELEGPNLPFNPVECSWSDVLRELKKAQNAADTSEHGKGPLTRAVRKGVKMSKIVEPALAAIPDELCFLHGGLAIVFYLAQRRQRIRHGILEVFEDIPATIAMAYSKAKSFPEDKRLQNSIENLKVTLFDAIPSLIDALTPNSIFAKLTSPLRGFRAEDLLDVVQRAARRVEVCARDLQDGLVFETFLVGESIQKTTRTTQEHVEAIQGSISAVDRGVRGLNNQYEGIDSSILELRHLVSQQINDALASQNGLFQMLKDVVSVFMCDQQEPGLGMPHPRTPSLRPSSPEQLAALLRILEVPCGQELHDLAMVLRQSQEFDATCTLHGAMILASPKFQTWIAANHSDLLYVEGHLDPSTFGKTSPISYFCASLVRLFRESSLKRDSPTTMTLHFFCGQHVASNDDLQGPRGLIRSLLAQLLQNWPVASLDFIDLTAHEGSQSSIPTEDICQLLLLVVSQIPAHITVFCIIDDLDKFGRVQWDKDYWRLLELLASLLYAKGSEARFKVLMTSPAKSRTLQQQIPPEQRLEVTERDRMMGPRRQQSLWEATELAGGG